MKTKSIIGTATLVTLALALTACSGQGQAATPDSEGVTTLRLNYPPSISIAALHIAEDEGLFERENLKIETKQNLTAGAAAEAVMGGQVDLAWNNVAGAATAFSSDIPLRLVGITDYQVPDNMQVLVPEDSDINSVADLPGHSVAVLAPNTTCVLAIRSALEEQGVDSSTITFEVVAPGDHPTVLSSGKVDATCTIDPIRTQMMVDLGVRPIFDVTDSSLGSFPVGGFIASKQFADANGAALERFIKVLAEAAQMANDDPDLARETLEKHGELNPEIADQVTLTQYAIDPQDAEAVEALIEQMVQHGALEEPIDVDAFMGLN